MPTMTTNSGRESLMEGRSIFSDISEHGRLHMSGSDAIDLLNRLTTNDLSAFMSNSAISTVITNGDAKVIDYLLLAGDGRQGLWCVTSNKRSSTVADWLDLYTFGEDITTEDRTENTGQLIILKLPGASFSLAENEGFSIPANSSSSTENPFNSVMFSANFGQYLSYHILVPNKDDLPAVKSILKAQSIVEISTEEFENLRIHEGVPSYSKEFGEFNNPLEARLTGSISESKGCYTGQEVIARLQTYQKIQRLLMSFEADKNISIGTILTTKDGHNAGVVTSAYKNGSVTRGLALVSSKYANSDHLLTESEQNALIKLSDPNHALATEPSEL